MPLSEEIRARVNSGFISRESGKSRDSFSSDAVNRRQSKGQNKRKR